MKGRAFYQNGNTWTDATAQDTKNKELKQRTGGRGPDACIDAVGTEAHGTSIDALYDRAKVLVNTSDVEGFPNSYLQAWIRGVPVVTLIDPDGVIEREGLGVAKTHATSDRIVDADQQITQLV